MRTIRVRWMNLDTTTFSSEVKHVFHLKSKTCILMVFYWLTQLMETMKIPVKIFLCIISYCFIWKDIVSSSQLTVTVVWISDNYYHKILQNLSLSFSKNCTISDWLSAAVLIQERRLFGSSAYFSYGQNTKGNVERIKWGAYLVCTI